MSNPLYSLLQQNKQTGSMENLINQFNQFRRNFRGDPQQQVQQLLNSGRITQDQFNRAAEMANNLRHLLK